MWDNFQCLAVIFTLVAMGLVWKGLKNMFWSKKTVRAKKGTKRKNSKSDSKSKFPTPLIFTKQEDDDLKCPICREKGTNACSACKKVGYCCVDHQKLDWKNHKNECPPFSVQPIEGMGLGCVATRDLKAGFLLMEETPAIQAPTWMTPDQAEVGLRRCVTCGCKIETITKTCSLCSWPVCGADCEKSPVHTENECAEFVRRELKYNSLPQSWPCGMLIAGMRANRMKTQNPEKFKQLMALQDVHDVTPSSNQEIQELDLSAGMFDVLTMSGANSLNLEEFRKLIRIFRINACGGGASIVMGNRSDVTNCSVYLNISRLNHSCFGNCFTINVDSLKGTVRVHTAISIAKGEEFTISYFNRDSLISFFPTADRQHILRQQGFICKCKRCLDPTELYTFFSGIKCFKCSNHLKADSDKFGYLLPANPLNLETPDPCWRCHRCHVELPRSKVKERLPTTVLNAFSRMRKSGDPTTGTLKEYLEKFMELYEGGRDFKDNLHPSHWLIVQSLMFAAALRRENLPRMNKQDLRRRLEQLELLMTVEDKLFPGVRPSKSMNSWLETGTYFKDQFRFEHDGQARKELMKMMRIRCKIEREKVAVLMVAYHGREKETKALAGCLKDTDNLEKAFERTTLTMFRQ